MNAAPKGRNLAGIIPISGHKDSFDFPWPDYLQPLREGMLAIERSVYECAHAGCDSIWIICNDDVSPLVRSRLGDYVMNPRYFQEKDFVKRKDYHEKWTPIFYSPIAQKDRDRRDSLAWTILHGSLTSFVVSSKMSQWCTPTKYFVSFPQGIYHPGIVNKHKDDIRGPNSFFLATPSAETVRENRYMAFTFFPEDWPKFKYNAKSLCTGGNKSIPFQERWSSRNITLDKMFKLDIITKDKVIKVQEYYDLDSWASLREYYKSDIKIPRLSKQFMKPYIFKGGIDEHEEN